MEQVTLLRARYNRPFHLAITLVAPPSALASSYFLFLSSPRYIRRPPLLREPETLQGLVDIGGSREMYLKCRGKGSPTVVLVAGLKGSAEDWSNADKSAPTVFPEVAEFTRICAYDRPGTPVGEKPSRSDPVPQPTTAGMRSTICTPCLVSLARWGPLYLLGTLMAVWSPGFMRVRIPKTCAVSSLSTLSPKGFGMQRHLTSGRYSES